MYDHRKHVSFSFGLIVSLIMYVFKCMFLSNASNHGSILKLMKFRLIASLNPQNIQIII